MPVIPSVWECNRRVTVHAGPGIAAHPCSKKTKAKRLAAFLAQVVEHLPSKHKALSSNTSTAKIKKIDNILLNFLILWCCCFAQLDFKSLLYVSTSSVPFLFWNESSVRWQDSSCEALSGLSSQPHCALVSLPSSVFISMALSRVSMGHIFSLCSLGASHLSLRLCFYKCEFYN
jgi:hypothetical protein